MLTVCVCVCVCLQQLEDVVHYLNRPLPLKPCPGWAFVCGPAYAHMSAHCDGVRNATRETEGLGEKDGGL